MNNDEFDTMEEVEEALYELIDLGLVEAYGVDEDGSFIYKLTDLGYGVHEGLDDACRGAFSDSPPDVEADVEWLDDVEDEY